MNKQANNLDPVPFSEYPVLQPGPGTPPPVLESQWECVALLMPFSPIQSNSTAADEASPFFELCVAQINYNQGEFFSAQLLGSSGRTWWYLIDVNGTFVSTDGSFPANPVNLGWTLPDVNWFGNQVQNATCAGTSYLNWMKAQEVNWWKIPVPIPDTDPPLSAATWMWFDAGSNLPVRMMFGQGPPSSLMGDPNQLALFQMFSFTYFPVFSNSPQPAPPSSWTNPTFDGFSTGNPNNYELFTWSDNFGMTAFMTPVNEAFNPLPTRILYTWKPDGEYSVMTDRAQNSLMMCTYNPSLSYTSQIALLTGYEPKDAPFQLFSDNSFLINYVGDELTYLVANGGFSFPQESPEWVSTPGVQATIAATITDNPVLCPGQTVTVLAVLFPQAPPNYPDSTYLWTWYSPQSEDGGKSRPVTFMQSQAGVGVGTSLALADYFYYEEFSNWIDPSNYALQLQAAPSGTPNTGSEAQAAHAEAEVKAEIGLGDNSKE